MNTKVKELVELVVADNFVSAKKALTGLKKNARLTVFYDFLFYLYEVNNWTVSRGDDNVLLLLDPSDKREVVMIVKLAVSSKPLTEAQTRKELIALESKLAPKYNCSQFNLVSLSGFDNSACKFKEFNLLLSSWSFVEDLIREIRTEDDDPKKVLLFAHNKLAYDSIQALRRENRQIGVVQATGTGKSYLIARMMYDHKDEKKIVLAPSVYILNQLKSLVPWASSRTIYMTYTKASQLTPSELKLMEGSLIVLDEYHRCGAETWGPGVDRILNRNPDAEVFGTTATDVRYLDSGRDMSEELFDGVIAGRLSLSDAIVKRILPAPTYITSLYTLREEVESMREKVRQSKLTEEEKSAIEIEIQQIELDWENTSGVPEILKKHLPADMNKFIVFCKDKEHLSQMQEEVVEWFHEATGKKSKIYQMFIGKQDNEQQLNAFRQAKTKDKFYLLFVIDMLNEGIHISDVCGVILLRKTVSPIIFYQQIGRAIEVNAKHKPIIFDLVNNFQSIRIDDFFESLEEAEGRYRKKRDDADLEPNLPTIHITDETRKAVELLSDIDSRLQSWGVMFKCLKEYVENYSDALVPECFITASGIKLGKWVSRQRQDKKGKKISQKRQELLESIPSWSWGPDKDVWWNFFQCLAEYYEKHGNVLVSTDFKTLSRINLGKWVSTQRVAKKNSTLSQKRQELLESIPSWSWGPDKDVWWNFFQCLAEYYEKHGNVLVPRGYKTFSRINLGEWVGNQRFVKKNKKLSQKQQELLESIPGWSWDSLEDAWWDNFQCLAEYYEKHVNVLVPHEYKTLSGKSLGGWVGNQRTAKKNNKLSQKRQELLESIPGWEWEVKKIKK